MKLKCGILILLPLLTMGQDNLVPNGDFEFYASCPTSTSQISLAIPWISTSSPCSPDYYNACNLGTPTDNPHMGIPANITGFQSAHSGDGYAGVFTYRGSIPDGREYLQIQLTEPIQASVRYRVSFWVSLADKFQYAVGSIGVYLSDTLTMTCPDFPLVVTPSIESPQGQIMSDKDLWYHITDTFTSRFGGEQYLLIGNFRSAEESNLFWVDSGASTNHNKSYYYIDDVSVVALGDTVSGIGEHEQISFGIYPNPSNEVFEVRASTPLANSGTLTLYDTQGRSVLWQLVQKGTHSINVNAGAFQMAST